MPFVKRVVEPKYLSRASLRDEDGRAKVADQELEAVTNNTLCNALRQLATLVLLAEDIFSELTTQLEGITERSKVAQTKIEKIAVIVENYDPKKVPVPEGSLSDFAERKVHYKATNPLSTELFTPATRPASVRNLYARAIVDRVSNSVLDQLRKDTQHSPYLLCTPVLTTKRRRLYQKINADIETRIPNAVEQLRKWTSKEAIGDVTAFPDNSIRISSGVTLTPDELSECGSGDDEPIDHKLPSPEEQLQIIQSKFLPELIPINTSGKFFDRMCTSRKSLMHIETGTGETDTIKRRTRSRKPRGKRRNTISGTDQRELREAIAGDSPIAVGAEDTDENRTVIRSHSSDLLKKSPIDPTIKKSHFNSLKQWGKSRLKMIGRSPSASRDSFKDSIKTDKNKDAASVNENTLQETVTMRKKRTGDGERRSLQRCASYSSSEKSIGMPTTVQTTATINNGVKLRGSSIQKRVRRSGLAKDEIHSSSGNWSASSESGRTSIGSEITTTTVPPKSTTSAGTSNNSLNFYHGPPSSIISRRKFLNTSGSGSVTSEGTLTPDIIHDMHEDIETSSEFSCDTEGYYTSFHMDSGLKTLKEEESPSSPLHKSNALSNSSNSQNLTAENEYELFGKGSTSTTTSSAGTVCTTLMAAGSDRSLLSGPTVPERKSSLTKMNRSRNSNIHSANASLDRSMASPYSKSPFSSLRYNPARSYNEKKLLNQSSPEISGVQSSTITITRNVGNPMTAVAEIHTETEMESAKKSTGTSSPDSGHNTSSSPIEDSVSSAHGKNSLSEQDYSESSDLEGTDRIERIRHKTSINSARIPSMCVITPTNSDDESEAGFHNEGLQRDEKLSKQYSSRPKLDLPSKPPVEDNTTSGKVTVVENPKAVTKSHVHLKNPLIPLNSLMCKLKGVLPNKLTNKKSPTSKQYMHTDEQFDSGDYVTIADVKNNNQKVSLNTSVYGNNDVIRKNLQTVLSGKLPDTEYVSLNELPNCFNESKDFLLQNSEARPSPVLEKSQIQGAKVTLDSKGQVVYSSDTLKRRKGAHTTFEPGPFVQELVPTTTVVQRETADVVKVPDETDSFYRSPSPGSKPTSPQLGKLIIKAPVNPNGPITTEFMPLPTPKPSTIITAAPITKTPLIPTLTTNSHKQDAPRIVEAITRTGAYVNIHDAEGVSLSPTKDDTADCRHSNADQPTVKVYQPQLAHTNAASLTTPGSLQNKYHTAHIRGRHGAVDFTNPRLAQPPFWTLPKRLPNTNPYSDNKTFNRPSQAISQTPLNLPSSHSVNSQSDFSQDNIRISPIDPRTEGAFKSSTPSNKENIVNLSSKLMSPVKSTMSNEELYAVIHKSKKKLNIKDSLERSNSPALSSVSLSPGNSETNINVRSSFNKPETGYLGDPRSRSSWSVPSDRQNAPLPSFPYSNNYRPHKPDSTCADRYGPVPQTSRHDFKKLLLQHTVKLNTLNPQRTSQKLSAVEQLKLTKEQNPTINPSPNVSQINILNLSGSPKTYTNRKHIKPLVHQPVSPGRAGNLIKEHKVAPKIMLSPKSQWRFSSPRSDVLSTPIPEANNEDDTSNSSGEKRDSSPDDRKIQATVPINTKTHFGARRNLIPITENPLDPDSEVQESEVFPFSANISPNSASSKAALQAKRAEFFNSTPTTPPPSLSSFKFLPTASARSKREPQKELPQINTLETAL